MPTASLTGEGLKRYQRWLAVQRAKGQEPSPAMIQSYLQGEIQANIASDTGRRSLALNQEALDIRREAVEGDLATRNRRLDLLEDQQDRQSGADTIRGISEIAKTVGAVNQLTGGAITSGIKSVGSGIYDFFTGSDDAADYVSLGTETAAFADAFDFMDTTETFDAGSELFAGIGDYSTEILDDVMDWSDFF